MTVRYEEATIERIKDVVDLSRQMHEESQYRSIPFDVEWLAQSAYTNVIAPETGFGRLAYKDERPVGMILGALASYTFGPALFAYDFAWYVVPEVRGSMTAIRLLQSFQRWAAKQGALEMHLGVTTNVGAQETGKIFKRMGYDHVGCNYTLKL